jgi:hypothetical protein
VRLDHVFDDLRGDATKMLMRKSDGQFGIFRFITISTKV